MLVSIVAVLRHPSIPRQAPYLGRAVHAAFLALVAKRDPALAKELHCGEDTRPFTTAPFLPQGTDQPGAGPFLRFTCFHPELAAALLAVLRADAPTQLVLDKWPVEIEQWCFEPSEHPWAGHCTYHELIERWEHLRGPPREIGLAFFSPTAFHSGGRNLPLPLPHLVFGSLMERWNAYAPLTLDPALHQFATEALAISRFRLHSQMVTVAGGKQAGFVGSCTYLATGDDHHGIAALNCLADFAFYSGVGAKTAMGMGQTRRWPDACPLPD